MFKDRYQKKLFSLFNSGGSQPLEWWKVESKSGLVRNVKDEDLQLTVLELVGNNVATTHITSPPFSRNNLGLTLPCLTLFVKYFEQPFSFEVQIMDDASIRRRFRFSTYHSTIRVTTFMTSMGLPLKPGWNVVQLNLAEFTQRAYQTLYLETLNIQVHANCRLRKIYFSNRLYDDQELPKDYTLSLRKDNEKPVRGNKAIRTGV